jgi:hypothetical protein
VADYNYRHFRTHHVITEAIRTRRLCGIQPGEEAPGFTLADTDGRLWSLSTHRGKPLLLHFGSYS